MKVVDYLSKYDRIFIDYSAFKSQYFHDLHTILVHTPLSVYGGEKHVVVTQDTIKLLERDSQATIDMLKALQKSNIGYYRSFPVSEYEIIFERFTQKYSLLLITQDQSLAHTVLKHSYPVNHLEIDVVSIGKNGDLWAYNISQFDDDSDEDLPIPSSSPFSSKYLDNPVQFKGIEKYDIKLNHHLPKAGETVLTKNNGKLQLTALLTDRGGEGDIFHTSDKDIVCKIYKPDSLTQLKQEKLALLVTKPLKDKHIAYPQDLVYNLQNQFVGYTMNKGKGVEIGEYFAGRISANKFKSWTRLDLVTLCVSVLSIIKTYHNHHLLIGDINGGNFLVYRPDDVTLVDVDSSQVEKFPCPVGRPEYTPPELLGNKSYREFFRTFHNEYYSVAVLLFRIITIGINHTSKIGKIDHKGNVHSEKLVDKIMNMSFGFTLDEKKTMDFQNPRFAAIWSHLPSYIKEAFVNVFDKKGARSTSDNRLTVDEWIALFSSYKTQLENGSLLKTDSEANAFYFKNNIAYNLVQLDPIIQKDFLINVITLAEGIKILEATLNKHTKIQLPQEEVLTKLQKKGLYKSKEMVIKIVKNIGVLKQISCQLEM